MHYFPDDSRFLPINVKARWQHNQLRTALQCHESGHGRANTESTRFIVTRSENAASIARAADPHRFAWRRCPVAHFERGVETIHGQMEARARWKLRQHKQ